MYIHHLIGFFQFFQNDGYFCQKKKKKKQKNKKTKKQIFNPKKPPKCPNHQHIYIIRDGTQSYPMLFSQTISYDFYHPLSSVFNNIFKLIVIFC